VVIGVYESLLTEGLNEQIQTRPGLVPAYGTVDELNAFIGAARVTARRYLEYLADNGLAHREPRYGQVGRPEVWYRPKS